MNRAILDTDIFSEILKGRDVAVAAAAKNYRAAFGRFSITSITVMELVRGVRKKSRSIGIARLVEYLDAAEILDFDRPAAEVAGQIYADLERTGQPIGRADPMIAGLALHHGLVLVTANTSHFQRIRDLGYALEIENWRDVRPVS